MNDVLSRFSMDGSPIGATQEKAEEQDDGPMEDEVT
jgi:hypothetical protein